MDLKQQLLSQAFRLMQNPQVAKALQDPRVMRAVMEVLQASGRAKSTWRASVQGVLSRLNLATETEVQELRQLVLDLQERLAAAERADSSSDAACQTSDTGR